MPAAKDDSGAGIFQEAVATLISEVEQRTGNPLTESQKSGLYNAGSLMFLEAMSMGFYHADTDEKLQSWLQEIEGFTR